ncbi:MAG: heat-shock protein Hsp20 [Sulfurimonas sp. RIFCSPLOWO2_12_FULL_36_74]|uniref:Hsp20/alpha crystallin family protein n=1 Tax=Sulfurimonas sp. RIFCSPLOWO2_12_36_12 TaxID=1802253 RepID=UPI0008D2CF7E|nr:Hsp20/alpha crystallin family protein [Sulfurimonas sp. RIFCSPLOWO2_12_36_12]OHD84598.1 MAG: heat-shock protein Hsp20 [Sulfuricurvum sp. RIFCSPHIGHO2_12_FULL_44_8]OHD88191.1 MAG: heat-shock protein Hsp20 [Sulfuricurvum sp. RIFCSPLOWO2_02_43_6]OHE02478.1 MAG: heat-shock protein Hsp20 [Sulfurimonas sp. RIFCSPLOWO2_12_36_12]OHE06361.1 MAG: heat-shock protein Hsp20 [Sulfurimonas sp. RIFCSPLOWO2_12_FULL_36_74]
MLLATYDSFKELKELEKRMLKGFPSMSQESALMGFSPVVNTREGEFAYHIEADLPGVKKEDISVETKDNVLTISGERKHKDEVKKDDYYKLESSYGKFVRSFTLPKGVDAENIKAVCENGVLEVTIPKLTKKDEDKKKIKVK